MDDPFVEARTLNPTHSAFAANHTHAATTMMWDAGRSTSGFDSQRRPFTMKTVWDRA